MHDIMKNSAMGKKEGRISEASGVIGLKKNRGFIYYKWKLN